MELDLEKVDLYGWQGRVGKPFIDSIIIGIEMGDDIPAVDVIKIDCSIPFLRHI